MTKGAEFKKQIAKPFGQFMRQYGFKGTGLEYFKKTEEFMFAVWIELGRWGGAKCSAGFAVHPMQVVENSEGPLDLTKLKIYQYEWRMSFTNDEGSMYWPYADGEKANLDTLTKIIEVFKERAFPVMNQFATKPSLLDSFEVAEMNKFYESWEQKTGFTVATSEYQFAKAMERIYERRDPSRAKQFAQWADSQPD